MPSVGIYEPVWADEQEPTQGPFIPFEHRDACYPTWRELSIYASMYQRGVHRRHALTGMFSPKFELKMGFGGEKVVDFIKANPGADVYLFNSASHLAYITYNSWTSGELSHPGLTERARALLGATRADLVPALANRQSPDTLCYANFWVASESFWEAYVGGVLMPIYDELARDTDAELARFVLEPTSHTSPSPFLAFIVERLLSTFLTAGHWTTAAYHRDPLEAAGLDFERDIVLALRESIERADVAGSFPIQLRNQMAVLSRLRSRFINEYYRKEAHPHTGRVVTLNDGAVDPMSILAGIPVPSL